MKYSFFKLILLSVFIGVLYSSQGATSYFSSEQHSGNFIFLSTANPAIENGWLMVEPTNYVFTAKVIIKCPEGWYTLASPIQAIGVNFSGLSGPQTVTDIEFKTHKIDWQGYPDNSEIIDAKVYVIDLNLKAHSFKSEEGSVDFKGFQEWSYDPSTSQLNGNSDKTLTIFYHKVIDGNLVVQNFDINLQAEVNPEELNLKKQWQKQKGPNGGIFDKTTEYQVKFLNPKQGGLYKFTFQFTKGLGKSEANVLLPLAGANVTQIVQSDMPKADAFAAKVLAKYPDITNLNYEHKFLLWSWFGQTFNFGGYAMSNYRGRPDNIEQPTSVYHNQMNPQTGAGAVSTWFEKPTLNAKLTNFMYAYTMAKMGFSLEVLSNDVVGTSDDPAATACYEMGYNVAHGKDYENEGYDKINQVWQWTNSDEHRKLWPNPAYPNSGNFQSPGWLTHEP